MDVCAKEGGPHGGPMPCEEAANLTAISRQTGVGVGSARAMIPEEESDAAAVVHSSPNGWGD